MKVCDQCGGIRPTEQSELIAGTQCRCAYEVAFPIPENTWEETEMILTEISVHRERTKNFNFGVYGMLANGIILVFGLILSSCTYDHYKATASNGNTVEETLINPGGTGSAKRSDGSSLVYDNQTSWRDTTNMAQTMVGGIVVGNVNKAKTASDNAASVATAKNASDAATAQAKIAADAAAAAQKGANQAAHFQTAAQGGLFTPVPLPVKTP